MIPAGAFVPKRDERERIKPGVQFQSSLCASSIANANGRTREQGRSIFPIKYSDHGSSLESYNASQPGRTCKRIAFK